VALEKEKRGEREKMENTHTHTHTQLPFSYVASQQLLQPPLGHSAAPGLGDVVCVAFVCVALLLGFSHLWP